MVTGLLLVVLASVLSGSASVMEARGAHRATAAGRPGVAGMARQPFYVIGLLIDLLGFLAAAAAMQYLPLFLVQAGVATSVGVSAVLARILGTPLGRRSACALVAMLVGLVLISLAARPGQVPPLSVWWSWAPLFWAAPTALLLVLGLRTKGARSAVLLALAAGSGFTAVAVAARTLAIPAGGWAALIDPGVLAVAINGVLATVSFAAALERGTVTMVASITYATETVLPSAVGLLFLGDAVRSGLAGVAAAGFVLAVGGAMTLAGFRPSVKPIVPPATAGAQAAGSAAPA
ncbi:hypothetical protein GIS00_08955 [Nakamurella sp. YIM 132087]|uniref:EamA family transporter n=1 Tax=Nakamurella alba TaxID=2665158 RepID=A0A7K1FIY4_9ACTN|nr:hypothetical protein [Nakamurella alba]MTD14072.1 hypothetical protein [Nakamurella alba]